MFTIVGKILTIPVLASAIIGSAYAQYSPFTFHLTDVILGQNTTTVAAANAPNWGIGIPIAQPVVSSIATSSYGSAASGLASSTTYYFAIAAIAGNGTTTLSSGVTMTTDASTTQTNPEVVNLKWNALNGATGYAIYFSTTTPLYNQYFLATTTGAYDFSTSTGSIGGTDVNTDSTAFSELINPNGPDIFNDSINISTSTVAASTTVIQANGTIDAVANGTTTACESDTVGSIFYNLANNHLWGCGSGGTWTKIY